MCVWTLLDKVPSGFKEVPKIYTATHWVPECPFPWPRQSSSVSASAGLQAVSWVSLAFVCRCLLIRFGVFHTPVPCVHVPSYQPSLSMQLNSSTMLTSNPCFITYCHWGIFCHRNSHGNLIKFINLHFAFYTLGNISLSLGHNTA